MSYQPDPDLHTLLPRVSSSRFADHLVLHSFPTRRSSDLGALPMFEMRSAALQPASVAARSASDTKRDTLPANMVRPFRSDLFVRSEEHTSELQSRENLVCRLLLEKKKTLNSESRASRNT